MRQAVETTSPFSSSTLFERTVVNGILGTIVTRMRRGAGTKVREPQATLVRDVATQGQRDVTLDRAHSGAEVPREALTRRLEPGVVLKDRFVLEQTIGRGGMGIVFGALDRRKQEALDPDPRVAIKVLNADFRAHPQAFMALQREALRAQSLAHPNVITVFDFDRDGDVVFMTMEWLRGRSLEAVVSDGEGRGLGRQAALPIIRGIAEGLAYAHRKGIVHSDLKPANVFLLEDGTPRILDFGIARAAPSLAAATGPRDVFDAGALGAYTEAYATPEMIDGGEPHPAHDLYALGLIAYELLTGRHPYRRNGVVKARELGLRPARVPALKRHEWRVLERCLAFDEAKRPRDAGEFLRLFFGVTRLKKSVLAVVIALTLASGYLWYRNYVQAGPAVALSQLPLATQQRVRADLAEAGQEWSYYKKDGNIFALWSAVDRYAEAYRLHPRNRDAVGGLEKAADEFLERTKGDPGMRRQVAAALAEKNEYLAKYAPVIDAQGAAATQ